MSEYSPHFNPDTTGKRFGTPVLKPPTDGVYDELFPQLTDTGVDWGSEDTTFAFEVEHAASAATETLAAFYNTKSRIKLVSENNALKVYDDTLDNNVITAIGYNLGGGVRYNVAWEVGAVPRQTKTIISVKGVIVFDSGWITYEGDFSSDSDAWLRNAAGTEVYSGEMTNAEIYKRVLTDKEVKAIAKNNDPLPAWRYLTDYWAAVVDGTSFFGNWVNMVFEGETGLPVDSNGNSYFEIGGYRYTIGQIEQ